MSLLQVESALSWAVSIANDDNYYYAQPSVLPYGMDCSTFCIKAYDQAGVDTHSASYTGDMESELIRDNVFISITFDYSSARRGDIFLKHISGSNGHCCLYLGNGQIVHAANSASGILVANYYENGYQKILRLTNQVPTSASWHAKQTGEYAESSSEAQENAIKIFETLSGYGWTLEAVSGFLGNLGRESGYNPWRWEGDVVISATDDYNITESRIHGYGLVQFTPAGKYVRDTNAQAMLNFSPNFSDVSGTPEDGRAQCEFINSYADYYPTSSYPQTYNEFKAWTGSPEDAASIWIHNYERPLSYDTEGTRRATARRWFEFLGGYTPPPQRRSSKLPIWLLNKIIRKEL